MRTTWTFFYYILSGQNEPNPALLLATRAGEMGLSCPLGTACLYRKKNFPKSHIVEPLLTKVVRSRWLDIVLFHFLCISGPRLRLCPKPRKKKKKKLGQYPTILN